MALVEPTPALPKFIPGGVVAIDGIELGNVDGTVEFVGLGPENETPEYIDPGANDAGMAPVTGLGGVFETFPKGSCGP